MGAPFIQLTTGRWPSGDCKPIAHLDLEPLQIAERLKIDFSTGRDDLGEFLEAGIKTDSGRLLLFLRYVEIATPGTSVLADADDNAEEAEKELNALFT